MLKFILFKTEGLSIINCWKRLTVNRIIFAQNKNHEPIDEKDFDLILSTHSLSQKHNEREV